MAVPPALTSPKFSSTPWTDRTATGAAAGAAVAVSFAALLSAALVAVVAVFLVLAMTGCSSPVGMFGVRRPWWEDLPGMGGAVVMSLLYGQ